MINYTTVFFSDNNSKDIWEAHDWCGNHIGKVAQEWFFTAVPNGWRFLFCNENDAFMFKLVWA
jgi:hypothetical protein